MQCSLVQLISSATVMCGRIMGMYCGDGMKHYWDGMDEN